MPTLKTNEILFRHVFRIFLELMVVANLGKNLRPSTEGNGVLVSDSFAFMKTKSGKHNAFLVQ